MFKQVVDAARQMLFLLRDVEQNKRDIAGLKEQLAETNQMLRQLAFELQRSSEREQQEREKFVLRGKTFCSVNGSFHPPAAAKSGNNFRA